MKFSTFTLSILCLSLAIGIVSPDIASANNAYFPCSDEADNFISAQQYRKNTMAAQQASLDTLKQQMLDLISYQNTLKAIEDIPIKNLIAGRSDLYYPGTYETYQTSLTETQNAIDNLLAQIEITKENNVNYRSAVNAAIANEMYYYGLLKQCLAIYNF